MNISNFIILLGLISFQGWSQSDKHRVFIFTDINIDQGDPDDRQSLVHLLWYANELEIEGIVPDRWNAQGLEASRMVVAAYAQDYQHYNFKEHGYPHPDQVKDLLATDQEDAMKQFIQVASKSNQRPLYVLVWGNMKNIKEALNRHPHLAGNIRLITIGTGLKYGPRDEIAGNDCTTPNWNGPGRNEIYHDPRFDQMWWLEINWTYNGMFSEPGPATMFQKLSNYGAMGGHIKFVTKNHDWAQYFRVGDTPSVLYLIDQGHDPDDPCQSSWAGKFKKPFPQTRSHYFTDDNGEVEWNYHDPCKTWNNVKKMYAYNKSTLEKERSEMYVALLRKLNQVYDRSER
ncbi:MAG: nucleoside hydrolase-like domain-containing protein [Candidatus Cyclobacteriaceae bacterium M3_2C_046]